MMSVPVAGMAPRRRPWVEPILWMVVPALLAVLPWAARQWRSQRPAGSGARGVGVRLSGDLRRDRLVLLERAWAEARPQAAPQELPVAVLDRMARRDSAWLS